MMIASSNDRSSPGRQEQEQPLHQRFDLGCLSTWRQQKRRWRRRRRTVLFWRDWRWSSSLYGQWTIIIMMLMMMMMTTKTMIFVQGFATFLLSSAQCLTELDTSEVIMNQLVREAMLNDPVQLQIMSAIDDHQVPITLKHLHDQDDHPTELQTILLLDHEEGKDIQYPITIQVHVTTVSSSAAADVSGKQQQSRDPGDYQFILQLDMDSASHFVKGSCKGQKRVAGQRGGAMATLLIDSLDHDHRDGSSSSSTTSVQLMAAWASNYEQVKLLQGFQFWTAQNYYKNNNKSNSQNPPQLDNVVKDSMTNATKEEDDVGVGGTTTTWYDHVVSEEACQEQQHLHEGGGGNSSSSSSTSSIEIPSHLGTIQSVSAAGSDDDNNHLVHLHVIREVQDDGNSSDGNPSMVLLDIGLTTSVDNNNNTNVMDKDNNKKSSLSSTISHIVFQVWTTSGLIKHNNNNNNKVDGHGDSGANVQVIPAHWMSIDDAPTVAPCWKQQRLLLQRPSSNNTIHNNDKKEEKDWPMVVTLKIPEQDSNTHVVISIQAIYDLLVNDDDNTTTTRLYKTPTLDLHWKPSSSSSSSSTTNNNSNNNMKENKEEKDGKLVQEEARGGSSGGGGGNSQALRRNSIRQRVQERIHEKEQLQQQPKKDNIITRPQRITTTMKKRQDTTTSLSLEENIQQNLRAELKQLEEQERQQQQQQVDTKIHNQQEQEHKKHDKSSHEVHHGNTGDLHHHHPHRLHEPSSKEEEGAVPVILWQDSSYFMGLFILVGGVYGTIVICAVVRKWIIPKGRQE